MIWLSLQPSPASEASAFNKIRAFIRRCAGPRPFRVSAQAADVRRRSTAQHILYDNFLRSHDRLRRPVTTKANHQIIQIG